MRNVFWIDFLIKINIMCLVYDIFKYFFDICYFLIQPKFIALDPLNVCFWQVCDYWSAKVRVIQKVKYKFSFFTGIGM